MDGVNYSASYVNYADKLPAAAFDLAKSVVLDGAKRSLVRGQPVKDPVYKNIQMGSISGVEVTASGDEKKLRGRVWLVNQVTYQIVVLAPKDFANVDQITRFLDSFALLTATSIP